MQQEGKISIHLKTAFPHPNATFQSNRSQWNWELDDVCLYWCGPLMSAPPLVSGSWSLQNTTILCPNLADIMNHDTGGSWGTSSQVQLYCDSRFLENKFQDFNEARLLLSKKDYCWVRAHHIGDLGWESCSTAAAHQTCVREEGLALTKEDYIIRWVRRWGLERGHNLPTYLGAWGT